MRGAQGKRCDVVGVRRRSQVFAFLSAPVDTCLLSYCPHPSLCSLGYNDIRAEGIFALAAILKETQITQLECAAA